MTHPRLQRRGGLRCDERIELERDRQHLVESRHVVDGQRLADVLRDLFDVGLVALREDDVGDPRAMSRRGA
jgi:hypothetical protein